MPLPMRGPVAIRTLAVDAQRRRSAARSGVGRQPELAIETFKKMRVLVQLLDQTLEPLKQEKSKNQHAKPSLCAWEKK